MSTEVYTVTHLPALAHFEQLLAICLTPPFVRPRGFPSALVLFVLFSFTWQSSSALRVEQRNFALSDINLVTVFKFLLQSSLSRGLFYFSCLATSLI